MLSKGGRACFRKALFPCCGGKLGTELDTKIDKASGHISSAMLFGNYPFSFYKKTRNESEVHARPLLSI